MIDWTRVLELREEIGEEDFSEIVEIFLEEVEGVILTLEPDGVDLENQLHFLKGSALNLGFRAFSALCEEGEAQAADGLQAEVDVLRIKTVYFASRGEFASKLDLRMAS